jgi:hypothetical protein
MTYRIRGLAALSDLLGDFMVYRSLRPADRRLPGLADLAEPLCLDAKAAPRKAELDYGRVVAEILRHARACDRPGAAIRHLLDVGDTHMNDGTAFRNLCAAGGWPALHDFIRFAAGQGVALGGGTALVIDLDKTAIGARVRNDGVIDEARILAVRRTVAHLLGPAVRRGGISARVRRAQPARVSPLYRGQPGLPGLHLPHVGRGPV